MGFVGVFKRYGGGCMVVVVVCWWVVFELWGVLGLRWGEFRVGGVG
ncbi:hypothetical protein DRN94_001020 [archaeon]|nr:hypothetical protein [archaeon]